MNINACIIAKNSTIATSTARNNSRLLFTIMVKTKTLVETSFKRLEKQNYTATLHRHLSFFIRSIEFMKSWKHSYTHFDVSYKSKKKKYFQNYFLGWQNKGTTVLVFFQRTYRSLYTKIQAPAIHCSVSICKLLFRSVQIFETQFPLIHFSIQKKKVWYFGNYFAGFGPFHIETD